MELNESWRCGSFGSTGLKRYTQHTGQTGSNATSEKRKFASSHSHHHHLHLHNSHDLFITSSIFAKKEKKSGFFRKTWSRDNSRLNGLFVDAQKIPVGFNWKNCNSEE
jgi:hypothetical protein